MTEPTTTHAGPSTDTEDLHDHAAGHGHEPAGEPLGPVNLRAWGYALGGAAVGALVVLALLVAAGS
jgi:hypothetical protein